MLLPAVACVRCNESVVSRSIQTVSIGTVFGRKRTFDRADKILDNLTGTRNELFSASRSVTTILPVGNICPVYRETKCLIIVLTDLIGFKDRIAILKISYL